MQRVATAAALALLLALPHVAVAKDGPCGRPDGVALRDDFWRRQQPLHPLLGQVLKSGKPIEVDAAACNRSPLQQLIAEVWQAIGDGGIVLLGEVHDNPEHHAVRGDILRPRLARLLPSRDLRPAAVLEHIRTSQQSQLDGFYGKAKRSRRLWRAPDLLRELGWESSGWPQGKIFEPLFDAALRGKLPIYPGNGPRDVPGAWPAAMRQT